MISDITKCKGNNCIVKDKCIRFTTKSKEYRQSWFQVEPIYYLENVQFCDFFWFQKNEVPINYYTSKLNTL